MSTQQPQFPGIESLTLNDIVDWAGDTIVARGRRYQRGGNVVDLAITRDGKLLGDVQGSDLYSVVVCANEKGVLFSVCSCPYAMDCKHGVAVMLDYIDRLNQGQPVSIASDDDSRLDLLDEDAYFDDEEDADDEYEDRDEDEYDDAEWENDEDETPVLSKASGSMLTKPLSENPSFLPNIDEDACVIRHLEKLTKKQLIAKIITLSTEIPELRAYLRDEMRVYAPDTTALLKDLRREIKRVSQIPGWSDHWSGEGSFPDYSGVRRKMRALLDAGHPDAVLDEGLELLKLGKEQVEESGDEGETAEELARCVDLVAEALDASRNLSPEDKLMWAMDAVLDDEYDIADALVDFLEDSHPPEAWDTVASRLAARLADMPVSNDRYLRFYHRNTLRDWLICALEHAGREDEIFPLCESEAKITGDYQHLVKRLMASGNDDAAMEWIRQGIKLRGSDGPGHVHGLRDSAREIYRRRCDWRALVLLEIEDFVYRPDTALFARCRDAAEADKTWPAVRETLMAFLVSGTLPWKHPVWPFGDSEFQATMPGEQRKSDFPMVTTLIRIAMEEKIPESVEYWYSLCSPDHLDPFFHDSIASALRDRFPEKTIAIWKQLAQSAVSRVNKTGYAQAGSYLRKLQKMMLGNDLQGEWSAYADSLRKEHARKRLFMEVLDSLDAKPLLKK